MPSPIPTCPSDILPFPDFLGAPFGGAHLHSPALAPGAHLHCTERSAVQVSVRQAVSPRRARGPNGVQVSRREGEGWGGAG
jgi:hypothetical protein